MCRGIDTVKAMGQYAHCADLMFQARLMCNDINPVGQPAHHGDTVRGQSGSDLLAYCSSIPGRVAGTDDIHDPGSIQVGIAFKVQQQGTVCTMVEALRVCSVCIKNRLYVKLLYEAELLLYAVKIAKLLNGGGTYSAYLRQAFEFTLTGIENIAGAFEMRDQLFSGNISDLGNTGKGYLVK